MKLGKMLVKCVICAALGTVLLVLGIAEVVDAFWSGMGSGLLVVSAVRLVGLCRLHKDESYREKVETEISDERNRFIRNKAWAWAGYLFILITSVAVIVLRVMEQNLLSTVACGAVWLMLILYWGAYFILRKKY